MNLNILEVASLFTYVATPEEIEVERQSIEAELDRSIAIYSVEHPTMSGARMTRVTWQQN